MGLMKSVQYTSRLSGWRGLVRVRGGEGGRKQAKYGVVTGSAPQRSPEYPPTPPTCSPRPISDPPAPNHLPDGVVFSPNP